MTKSGHPHNLRHPHAIFVQYYHSPMPVLTCSHLFVAGSRLFWIALLLCVGYITSFVTCISLYTDWLKYCCFGPQFTLAQGERLAAQYGSCVKDGLAFIVDRAKTCDASYIPAYIYGLFITAWVLLGLTLVMWFVTRDYYKENMRRGIASSFAVSDPRLADYFQEYIPDIAKKPLIPFEQSCHRLCWMPGNLIFSSVELEFDWIKFIVRLVAFIIASALGLFVYSVLAMTYAWCCYVKCGSPYSTNKGLCTDPWSDIYVETGGEAIYHYISADAIFWIIAVGLCALILWGYLFFVYVYGGIGIRSFFTRYIQHVRAHEQDVLEHLLGDSSVERKSAEEKQNAIETLAQQPLYAPQASTAKTV